LDDKYKSLKLYFGCIEKILSGNYTAFEVFEIYNDSTLKELLVTSCGIIFSADTQLLEVYPKVFTRIYNVISVITRDHTPFLLNCNIFGKLLELILIGLQSSVKEIITESCNSLYNFFLLHITNLEHLQLPELILPSNNQHQIEFVLNQLSQHHKLLQYLFLQLFHLLITDRMDHSLSRPLLILFIVSSQDFHEVKDLILKNQSVEKIQSLTTLFQQLLSGIQMNLEFSNKEKFTSQLTNFTKELRNIIDLSLFYKTMAIFINKHD